SAGGGIYEQLRCREIDLRRCFKRQDARARACGKYGEGNQRDDDGRADERAWGMHLRRLQSEVIKIERSHKLTCRARGASIEFSHSTSSLTDSRLNGYSRLADARIPSHSASRYR